MDEAYNIARTNATKNQYANSKRWNSKPLLTTLAKGDKVLVQNKETGGPGKLRSFWEQCIWRIVDKKGDQDVVYVIEKENGTKRKTVH